MCARVSYVGIGERARGGPHALMGTIAMRVASTRTLGPPRCGGCPRDEGTFMRVLLAEDNVRLARATEVILEKNGLDVEVAHDGLEALDALDRGYFDVAVLELPYIFGTQPGRKPVWVFLVENVMSMKAFTLYPKGGSTMVTVHQVAEAIAGAIERNRGGHCYPIGYYNLTWVEMLKIVHKYLGVPDKRIVTIPNWMYALGGKKLMKEQAQKGIQGGLNMVKFTDVMCSNLFIDKSEGCDFLGVTDDDIDAAIGDSILLCKDILEKKTQVLGMKGE